MTHYEVIPVPDSPARSPLFTTKTTTQDWTRSGTTYEQEQHTHRSNPYMPYEDRETAIADLFPSHTSMGGYELAYVGDGYILCADCVRKAFDDPTEPDHEALHNGEITASQLGDDYGTGDYCDHCNAAIREPGCADCGTEEGDDKFHAPVFVKESGDAQICATCMARHVVEETATKTGKGIYEVELNTPWYGGGTYRADWTS
jgi:hypothetical protein